MYIFRNGFNILPLLMQLMVPGPDLKLQEQMILLPEEPFTDGFNSAWVGRREPAPDCKAPAAWIRLPVLCPAVVNNQVQRLSSQILRLPGPHHCSVLGQLLVASGASPSPVMDFTRDMKILLNWCHAPRPPASDAIFPQDKSCPGGFFHAYSPCGT